MRGITDDDMPRLVMTNVLSRFRHMESTYGMFPDLVDEQRKRVNVVTYYFSNIIR